MQLQQQLHCKDNYNAFYIKMLLASKLYTTITTSTLTNATAAAAAAERGQQQLVDLCDIYTEALLKVYFH